MGRARQAGNQVTKIYLNEKSAHKPILNAVMVFLFVLFATMIVLSYFMFNLWFIVGLALIVVVLFACGYGFSSMFGFALGTAFWLFGILAGIVNAITGPIQGFLHGIGL